jgi:hypothetical protein
VGCTAERVALSDHERTGYLPKLIDDLIVRLRPPRITIQEGGFIGSPAAVAHENCEGQKVTPLRCWCRTHEYSR